METIHVEEPVSENMKKFNDAFRGLWGTVTAFSPGNEVMFEGPRCRIPSHEYHLYTRAIGWSVQYSNTQFIRFFGVIEKLFPNQVSISSVHKITLNSILTCFETIGLRGETPLVLPSTDISNLAVAVYNEISSTIRDYVITVPIWGFETPADFKFPLYEGLLFRQPELSGNSHLASLWDLESQVHEGNHFYGIVFYL